jgi:hypothetical protein
MKIADFDMVELATYSTVATAAGVVALLVGLPLQQYLGMGTRSIMITAFWLGSLGPLAWAIASLPFVVGNKHVVTVIVYSGALACADVHVLSPLIRALFTSLSLSGEVQQPVATILGAFAFYVGLIRLWAPAVGNIAYAWMVEHNCMSYGYYYAVGCSLVSCVIITGMPSLDDMEQKAARAQWSSSPERESLLSPAVDPKTLPRPFVRR